MLVAHVAYLLSIKDSVAFQKGCFAPTVPLSERQEGHLIHFAPLSGVSEYYSVNFKILTNFCSNSIVFIAKA